MSLTTDLETLAHELECDPTYNFKGLMTLDENRVPDMFTAKLARVREGVALLEAMQETAKEQSRVHAQMHNRIVLLETFMGAAVRWRDAIQKANLDRPCDLPLITEIDIITR